MRKPKPVICSFCDIADNAPECGMMIYCVDGKRNLAICQDCVLTCNKVLFDKLHAYKAHGCKSEEKEKVNNEFSIHN